MVDLVEHHQEREANHAAAHVERKYASLFPQFGGPSLALSIHLLLGCLLLITCLLAALGLLSRLLLLDLRFFSFLLLFLKIVEFKHGLAD